MLTASILRLGISIRVTRESSNTALENSIATTLNPFRYRGYYLDVETGLYYLQSRYYNPNWGRFINADGVAYLGAGDELLGYNLFSYCGNNPVMGVDPTGEAWWHWAIAATVVVACFAATVATCGMSLSGAAMAIGMVASGSAAFSTASTIAATATLVSGLTLGGMAIFAAIHSNSAQDFADQGNWGTVIGTMLSATMGGFSGYGSYTQYYSSNKETFNLNGSKNQNYVNKRGWSTSSITDAINNGKMGSSINKANGASCSVYCYPGTRSYVVIENDSRSLVQASQFGDSAWIPDSSIVWDP